MVIQGPSRLFVKQKEGWWFNLNISRSNLHFLFDHLFFKIENYWNADSKPIYLLTFSFRADLTQIQPWCINFTDLQIIRLITSIQPGRNQTKEMASGKSDPDCSICNITSFFKSVSLKKTKKFWKTHLSCEWAMVVAGEARGAIRELLSPSSASRPQNMGTHTMEKDKLDANQMVATENIENRKHATSILPFCFSTFLIEFWSSGKWMGFPQMHCDDDKFYCNISNHVISEKPNREWEDIKGFCANNNLSSCLICPQV